MWGAAQRLIGHEKAGRDTVVVHLGDHDPSGLDMTRDIQERLEMFGSTAIIDRIALTWEQIEEYGPPPNPAKTTDARYANVPGAVRRRQLGVGRAGTAGHGGPDPRRRQARIDQDYWQEALGRQDTGRDQLGKVSRRWQSWSSTWATAMETASEQ